MNKQTMRKKNTEHKEHIKHTDENGKHKPDDRHNKAINEIFKETIQTLADEIRREHQDAGLDIPDDTELAKKVRKRLEKGFVRAKGRR